MTNIFGQVEHQYRQSKRFCFEYALIFLSFELVICGQVIPIAQKEYVFPIVKTKNLTVGILISIYHYYQQTIQRKEKPAESATIIGWILPGNVEIYNTAATNLHLSSHILKFEV